MIAYGFVILLLTSIPIGYRSCIQSKNNARQQQMFIKELEQLKQINSQGIFVTQGDSLSVELLSPFVTTKTLPKLNLIPLGWMINSPPHLNWLSKLGITDLYEAIATRDDVYLISSDSNIPLYEQYMWEHYQKKVKLKKILIANNFFINIFQCCAN